MVYRRDIGGQAKLRRLWRHYYLNTDALIFVLDSSDHERMEEARDEMFHVLMDPYMDECQTVLIFLNKQVEAVNERVPIANTELQQAYQAKSSCLRPKQAFLNFGIAATKKRGC